METVCQVVFGLMTRDEARKAEIILREYLLNVCDEVSFTCRNSSWLSIFPMPHPLEHHKFEKLINSGDVTHKSEQSWTFKLTENIKNLINSATLFDLGKNFYEFYDPKFTSTGNVIASYIQSEKIMSLYIPDSDKAILSDHGVYLDSSEI